MKVHEADAWPILRVKKQPYRKRRTREKLFFVFCLCTAIGAGVLVNDGATDVVEPQSVTYTVKPGDTLWDIAEKYKTTGQDIRVMYLQIMEDNRISHNEDIYPGQKLIIPQQRR